MYQVMYECYDGKDIPMYVDESSQKFRTKKLTYEYMKKCAEEEATELNNSFPNAYSVWYNKNEVMVTKRTKDGIEPLTLYYFMKK